MSDQNALFITILRQLALVTYVEAGAIAIFVFDYLITLGMEINLVWFSRWSFVKALYFFQRYSPFFDSFVPWIYRQTAAHTGRECSKITYAFIAMNMVGITASELLMGIRVWSIWSHNNTLRYLVPAFFVVVWIPSCVGTYFFAASLTFSENPPYPTFAGCLVTGANAIYIIPSWVSYIAWDTFSLVLVMVPGIRASRAGTLSGLSHVVYREGSFYYIIFFAMSVMNIIIYTTIQDATRAIITSLVRYLRTMLASRALLHMREQAYVEEADSPSKMMSLVFNNPGTSGHVPENAESGSGQVFELRRLRVPAVS
ncbi:hypothetical protein CPC08DRAFT_219776 [Agrocybe pediades]|nr:hypothetical protein CPC08DRAFT_219776 [Agrocybe pediades]